MYRVINLKQTAARGYPRERWWDDTALQTQDSKFESWRSEAEHATSRSRRLTTIVNLYEWTGKKHFVPLKLESQSGATLFELVRVIAELGLWQTVLRIDWILRSVSSSPSSGWPGTCLTEGWNLSYVSSICLQDSWKWLSSDISYYRIDPSSLHYPRNRRVPQIVKSNCLFRRLTLPCSQNTMLIFYIRAYIF